MSDDDIHDMMDRAHYAEIREQRLRIEVDRLKAENAQLKFALDRWKLAESLDLECQCAPDNQVKTFTRNCGYVCGQCGKLIGLPDAALSPQEAPK